ncbi:MAG: response regulator [Eubacteriales bacterium]|nr:response regulator [Eubacteriales bacterium]
MTRENLTVLVVDDETPIREWITVCMRDYPGISRIETARNGEEALNLLSAKPCDIVLTDITMPRLNGLDLLNAIKKVSPETVVVIMSVHNDFEHARTALKNGAHDYILKNEITRESLYAMLDKIALSLMPTATVEEIVQSNVDPIIRSQYIQQMLLDNQIHLSIENLHKHKIELTDSPLFACALPMMAPDSLAGIEQEWGTHLRHVTYLTYGKSYVLILANCDADDAWLSGLTQMISLVTGSPIGLSRIYPGLSDLLPAIREALQACKRAFYQLGEGQVLPAISRDEEKSIKQAIEQSLNQAVEHYRQHRCDKAIDQILQTIQTIRQNLLADIDYVKDMLAMTAHRMVIGSSKLEIDIKALENAIQTAKSIQELQSAMKPLLDDMLACDVYSKPVAQAIEYIAQNYGHPMTLSDVADAVHLNEEYFSRLFKKEMGVNFTEYLLNLRMEMARKLLLTTHEKISRIAEQVGISDSKYFSLLFRKTFNQTPSQIREHS